MLFSILVVSNQLSTIIINMLNFVAKFGRIHDICKKFAGNQVNKRGNVTRCGVVIKGFFGILHPIMARILLVRT